MKKLLLLLGITILALATTSPASATSTLPSGETHFATYITTSTAILNGYITDDGGEPCQARFQYYYGTGTWTDNATPWLTGYVTGDNPTANITGLTDGELYYYRIEIENSAGTFDGDSEAFSAYDAPSMPAAWFATPDVERFKNAFFYGLYNFLADEIKMPRATFYLLATLLVSVALGIGTLIVSKRLMPAVIVLCGFMSLFSLMRLLPMYFVAFSIIAIWGTIKMGHPREE
jgi:hypothetical protein